MKPTIIGLMPVCRRQNALLVALTLLVILFPLYFHDLARAELATLEEMEQVCRNLLAERLARNGEWAGSDKPEIVAVNEIRSGDTLLARYYTISPTGFVLVPVLKEMQPVKAYSDNAILDERQEGGFLSMIRELLARRLELYARLYGSADAIQPDQGEAVFGQSQRRLWDKYALPTGAFLEAVAKEKSPSEEGGPICTSLWHQRAPYNNYCPMGNGGRCVVGCVATAAAQVMYYWEWPPNGLGQYTYTWAGDYSCEGSTPGQDLTADFSDSYDWANMVDGCGGGCNSAQDAALAELNYEVGVAFNMEYGACGSGASVMRAPLVFREFFKYSPDVHQENRINYDLPGWYNLIKDQIVAGWPIQYRINRHSIVCDGYRSSEGRYEYHMNYGWTNAGFTTWYVFDSLYCYWVLPDSVCPADEEFMIVDIHPQDKPVIDMIAHAISESTGDADGHPDPGESVSISATIENNGIDAVNTVGTLSTTDSYLTISTPSVTFDTPIPWGGQSASPVPFEIEVSPSCPDPHVALCELQLSADGGYSTTDTILVFIGDTPNFADDFETGSAYWRHWSVSPTFADEWHLETQSAHSGNNSWKAGGLLNGQYCNSSDGGLISPPFLLPAREAELTFWHRMEAEIDSAAGMAWDGAIVMIAPVGGSWSQIFPDGGYPYSIVDNPESPYAPNTPCYSGNFNWQEATFDLSAYSGVVQLMFRFGSDAYVTWEGWYVDDVAVSGMNYLCGDANGDQDANIGDAVYIINYVFKGGAAPDPEAAGDANCDGRCDVGDAVYLINYVFKDGNAPCAGCP